MATMSQSTCPPVIILLVATSLGGVLGCSSTSITPKDGDTGGTAGAAPSAAGGVNEGGDRTGGGPSEATAGVAEAGGGRASGEGGSGGAATGGAAGPGGAATGGAAGPGGAVAAGGVGPIGVGGGGEGAGEPGGATSSGGSGPGGAPADGGAGGHGETVDGGAGGSSTATGGGGGAAGGCLAADDPRVQDLHGCVEDLGVGRVRISYDFESDDQLLDWLGADQTMPPPTIDVLGRLVVATGASLNAVLFVLQMRADALDYRVSLVTGDHINVYVDTVWDGGWAPTYGLGCIQNPEGQSVVVDALWEPSPTPNVVRAGDRYVGSIVVTDSQLSWIVNDIEHVRVYDPRTRSTFRNVAIGAYASEVAFESVVLEGELAP